VEILFQALAAFGYNLGMDDILNASPPWHQYSLRTLLLIVAFVSALCSVGACTQWWVPAAVVAAMAFGGYVWGVCAGTRHGVALGAICGLYLSFVALLAATAAVYFRAPIAESGSKGQCSLPPSRPAGDIVKAVRAVVPSARAVDAGCSPQDKFSGRYFHYYRGGCVGGFEICLFPDNTYLSLTLCRTKVREWTITDRGTWQYRDGLVVLKTDREVVGPGIPLDSAYLPMTATIGTKDVFVLLGANGGLREFPTHRDPWQQFDTWYGRQYFYQRTETIVAGDAAAIKQSLYLRYPPEPARAPWRDVWRRHMMALGVMAILCVAVLLACRTRRPAPPTAAANHAGPPGSPDG
jgi:hypothetical protein